MRKLLIIFLSIFSLSACDSHLVNLNEVASQINSHIDHSQKDKMAYFLEKAEADPYNNAIVLFHRSNIPVDRKEFIVFKAMQMSGYCKNEEIDKALFRKGVKFVLVLKDTNGVEFDRAEISRESCYSPNSNNQSESNKSATAENSEDKAEKETRAKAEKEEKDKALREAKEKAEKEAKLKAEKKAKQQTSIKNNTSKSELEAVLSENMLHQMAKTYGLYVKQEYDLEQIKINYPSLKGQVVAAQNEFKRKFGASLENINAIMLKGNPDWNNIIRSGKSILQKRGSVVKSKQEAVNMIEDLEFLLESNLSELTGTELSHLLVFNPLYLSSPHLEFKDNYTYRFNTKGYKKSKDIDFSVKLPVSWQAKEGDRPNIIQKFTNYNGSGLSVFSIMVRNAPPESKLMSIALLKELFANEDDKKELSVMILEQLGEGAKYLNSQLFILENLPGMKVCFELNRDVAGHLITTEGCGYMVFYDQKVIVLHGATVTHIDSQPINDSGIKKYEKLFDLIANSLVINDLYKN